MDPASGFNGSGKSLTDDCAVRQARVSGLPSTTMSDGSPSASHVLRRHGLFTGRPENAMLDVLQQGLRA